MDMQCPIHGEPNNLIGMCCYNEAKLKASRPKIGHKSGCVKINCSGCGIDFYSNDYSKG